MAKINFQNILLLEKAKTSVHRPASASYSKYELNGKRYFHVDTYGSDTRKIEGKISQSIQLDEGSARALIKLLNDTFDL